MTLIAGYQYQNVPILFGDFMISGGAREYSLKKIHLISDNFVIGWTGHLFIAKGILRDLYSKFSGIHATRKQLEDFLINYPVEQNNSFVVHLVGWVVDDGTPLCFLWNSSYPQELFYEPYHVAGSGTNLFEDMLNSPAKMGVQGSKKTKYDLAIYYALNQACILMSDEVLDRNNNKMGFGHGYEILYFDGHKFKFVDDILYTTWDFYYDVKSKGGNFNFYPEVYKYRNFNYYSVIQINNFKSQLTKFNAIRPAFDNMPNIFDNIPSIDIEKGTVFPMDSKFYCLFFRFQASDMITSSGALVFHGGQPNLPFYINKVNGKEKLNFKFDFIPVLYEKIKNSQVK